jgi:hypothetical protein
VAVYTIANSLVNDFPLFGVALCETGGRIKCGNSYGGNKGSQRAGYRKAKSSNHYFLSMKPFAV